MPMSPRLLRPIANNIDPDAAIYLNAVAQADTQQLEPAVRKAINDFVVGCKRDNIWNAIKASCILMGARTLAGALTPLKGSAPTNTNNNFVSGDYDRETGLIGNANNKTLTSGVLADDQAVTNFSLAVWVSASPVTGTARQWIGSVSAAGTSGRRVGYSIDTQQVIVNAANSVNVAAAPENILGLAGLSRSSNTTTVRFSGSNTTATTTGTNTNNSSIIVFSANAATDSRLAFYSIGESLDLGLLDARVSALVTAIGAAI
jgi:hypothetical protein